MHNIELSKRAVVLSLTFSFLAVLVIGVGFIVAMDHATDVQEENQPVAAKQQMATLVEDSVPAEKMRAALKTTVEEKISLPHAFTEAPPSTSVLGVYENAAVSADGVPCAQIGRDIFAKNGSTVDAAIASLFCLGVVNTQSMGIGGGFFATYYNREQQMGYSLDAREVAPLNAKEDMYGGNGTLSTLGGLAVAVPGESRGYWELYKRFGGLVSWAEIIQPTIDLCVNGTPVNNHMANALISKRSNILSEPTMSVFVDQSTGDVYQEGDILYRPDLAATLMVLLEEPDALYNGSLTTGLLQDLQDLGSIITKEDLLLYTPKWRTPVNVSVDNGNYRLYSMPPPGSGGILAFILNILDNYNFTVDSLNPEVTVTTHQRITEALKYAYAKRTEQGDEDFVDMTQLLVNLTSEAYARSIFEKITDNETFQDPEYYGAVTYNKDDHGTSHLSVVGPDGDAISITSTVNLYFGAVIRSVSTGIVLNDEMDDFSSPNITNSFGLPPSPANFIEPGKRPLSSMCPAVLIDGNGDVRLVIGAAGGTKISSGTAWAAMENLWFGKDIKESIDSRRLHHQLFPMELAYEEDFQMDIVSGLEDIGHFSQQFGVGGSVVCGIARKNGTLYANSDFRKSGEVAGLS